MDCEKCIANCSCKGHPMTVENCARYDDGRGKSCSTCITNCPLRQSPGEGACEKHDDGEPTIKPTETQCLGMVLYEPPEDDER